MLRHHRPTHQAETTARPQANIPSSKQGYRENTDISEQLIFLSCRFFSKKTFLILHNTHSKKIEGGKEVWK